MNPNPNLCQIPRFTIAMPDEDLDDLRRRLNTTRWPDDVGNDDWSYGVNAGYMKELVDFWANGFDWRAAERKLNALHNYRVNVDGAPIHFVHAPGKGPSPLPLILCHGWPWSYTDFAKVIGPLSDPASHGGDPADAFDVIVPSLPGFGFSSPSVDPDLNIWKMSDILHKLMTEHLGNRRYAAGGSDMGSLVTAQLGHKYAESLYGLHLARGYRLDNLSGERPWDVTGGRMVPAGAPPHIREGILAYQSRFAGHRAVQVLEPETVTFALNDSPTGMLAWILHRWRTWSDCDGDVETVFPRDYMLTSATIWWWTRTIRSSMRAYAATARYQWQPVHDRMPVVEAPTGMTFLGFENPPGVTTENRVDAWRQSPDAQWYNAVYLNAHEKGGHFAAWENPEAVIADLRATFRLLR